MQEVLKSLQRMRTAAVMFSYEVNLSLWDFKIYQAKDIKEVVSECS